jgi:hypothetical protein
MRPSAKLVSREEKLFTCSKRLIYGDLGGQKQLVNHYAPPAILNIDGKKSYGRPQRVSRFSWCGGWGEMTNQATERARDASEATKLLEE